MYTSILSLIYPFKIYTQYWVHFFKNKDTFFICERKMYTCKLHERLELKKPIFISKFIKLFLHDLNNERHC